jgi:hypothetical protein
MEESNEPKPRGIFKAYLITVGVVLLASGALFISLYRRIDDVSHQAIRVEALKTLMQLAAVGIVAGLVTWILSEWSKEKERILAARRLEEDRRLSDRKTEEERALARRQRETERQEALNLFRREAAARLVTAMNVVRKAPILIESHQSKKTYGEQSRAILDASLELSLLRQEIVSSGAFLQADRIEEQINRMDPYVEGLISEWKERYKNLPVEPDDVAWASIQALPVLATVRKGEKTPVYEEYLSGYSNALEFMRAEIFKAPVEPDQA